jgi:hypothetical protein
MMMMYTDSERAREAANVWRIMFRGGNQIREVATHTPGGRAVTRMVWTMLRRDTDFITNSLSETAEDAPKRNPHINS